MGLTLHSWVEGGGGTTKNVMGVFIRNFEVRP